MKKITDILLKLNSIIIILIYTIISVGFIIFVFPHEAKFIYEYKIGSPWKHDNLIAKVDFPVYKPEKELQNEKDSIIKNYKPYYKLNTEIKAKSLNDFIYRLENASEEILESDSIKHLKKQTVKDSLNALKRRAVKTLENIYEIGIVETTYDTEKAQKNGINVINNKIVEQKHFNKLYTQKEAYEKMNFVLNGYKKKLKIPSPQIAIEKYVTPNIIFDIQTNETEIDRLVAQISPARGMVQAGEAIIFKGELVTSEKFRILESYRSEFALNNNSYSKLGLIAGEFIIFSLLFGVLFVYIYFFNPEIYKSNKQILYFFVTSMLIISLYAFFLKYEIHNIYLIPEIILPIMTVTFYKPRLALIHHIVTISVISFFAENSFEYLIIQFIAGFAAISWLTELNSRSQILKTTLITFGAYLISYVGYTLAHTGKISKEEVEMPIIFAANSSFVLMTYPLIYLFERIFGFISDVTLLELSNTNKPLLRELAEKAPGTFQHSVQVANIAEEAVREIGGNALLVRTGALYHDIGKLSNPAFFTENQYGGNNPHDKIDPVKSAEIIVNHISYGVATAKKYRLPKEIIDFIETHQGTGRISWFLNAYKQKNPDNEINEDLFRYPGPRPNSKETAVLLMADSLEAASRSLKEHTPENIDTLVENIVNYKFSEKQFDNADLTLAEITKVKAVIKEKLKNIYHTRIEYPK